MKTQIRKSVFETNSSSTHTLTLYCTTEWNEFKNNKIYLDACSNEFVTEDELRERFKKASKEYPGSYNLEDIESFDEWRRDECIYNIDEYEDSYEILEEEIQEVGKTAVSIYGYE